MIDIISSNVKSVIMSPYQKRHIGHCISKHSVKICEYIKIVSNIDNCTRQDNQLLVAVEMTFLRV